jgi:hypothetical protein
MPGQLRRPGHGLRRQHERGYQQTFIDTYSKVTFAKLYDRKTPTTRGRSAERPSRPSSTEKK